MNLAIITARGGSKRMPRKNIRDFCGQPIIVYPIQAAVASGCFDEVMVSTDDEEIAQVGRRWGATVPFMRSAETATDRATTAEAVSEVLDQYAARGRRIDLACCLYPTAAFVTAARLRAGRDLLLSRPELQGVMSVVAFSYPIQRALRMRGGVMSLIQPEHVVTRSQDLEPTYHDAGQFYWIRASRFQQSRNLMDAGMAGLLLGGHEVQDIDNQDDWIVAELKYRALQHQHEEQK